MPDRPAPPRPLRPAVGVVALSALLAPLLLASAGAAQHLTRGPLLQRPTADGITIVWELDPPGAPELRWGPMPERVQRHVAAAPARHHEVRLDGLEPGRTYHYALHGPGGETLDEPATFPTAAAPGQPVRFLLFGDTRSRAEVHRRIVAAMLAEPDVRFAVHTGDLVASGGSARQWDQFFDIERPLLRRVPFFPVVGNHDVSGGKADELTRRFALPVGAAGLRPYYSFDHGSLHVVVLDTYEHVEGPLWCRLHRHVRGTCFDDEQLGWLDADLAAAARSPAVDHVVVVTHVGPFSSTRTRGGSAQMRALLPLFRERGVTLIVSGHDHAYERGASPEGIVYVVTGGGGAPLYDVGFPSGPPHTTAVTAKIEHYVVGALEGRTLHLVAKTADGRELDSVSIPAPAKGDRAPSGGTVR